MQLQLGLEHLDVNLPTKQEEPRTMAPSSKFRKLARSATVHAACLASLLVLSGLPAAVANAAETILYDGTAPTTLPGTQGWVYVATPISAASATQTANGGFTTLDTTPDLAMGDMAGYFSEFPFSGSNPIVPVLDLLQGFRVTWDMRMDTENHTGTDRSGFSVIVISENPTKGLEIAFWEDEIWVQDDTPNLFTHGEGVAFDTTAAMTRYELRVLANDYVILADDRAILFGSMRDYTAFDSSPVPFNPGFPYDRPSFLFFGDDTSSGEAIVDLARIATFDSLPEQDADFDRDNDIDGRDFLAWQRGFGILNAATHEQGDANRDGMVDGDDLAIWEQQFGNTHLLAPPFLASTASMAVPEPASILLLHLVGFLLLSRRLPAG